MMMMMMSTFIVHDCTNLNVQCVEGCIGKKRKSHNLKLKKPQKRHMVQSYLQNRCIVRHLQNAAKEAASLIVCGRAFQSLGAELEKGSW